MRKLGLPALTIASAFALGSAVTSIANRLTTPALATGSAVRITEKVTVCIPARDEESRLPDLAHDLVAQRAVDHLRVVIYDDRSADRTVSRTTDAIAGDSRFTLVRGTTEPPDGWLGKSAACDQAARHPDSISADVLIFLDADVRLQPDALAAAVTELRRRGASLLSPWPVQVAHTLAERLFAPLLCWSWAATLPTALAHAVTAQSMVVACGQFLVFDAPSYRRIHGHSAVAASVTEDLDIARALRAVGLRTAVALAGEHASCRMYTDARQVRVGYGKWLWTAFGSPASTAAVLLAAVAIWVVPAAAALCGSGRTRRIGTLGYAAAVVSRLAARNMESRKSVGIRDLVDATTHPASILAAVALTLDSTRRHRLGRSRWKGRTIP